MAIEHDEQLWGGETAKAVENFQVSGIPVRLEVVHWLARIKGAAARVNADLGKLDPDVARRIADAADRVADGKFDDQFLIDVFQTGSGTSTNMNANEVIANLAGDGAHPNDHVNMGQSSNDVFPTAIHLAALDEVTTTCFRRWTARGRAGGQGARVRRRRQGRPHPPDGRRADHAGPGVRRLCRPGPPRRRRVRSSPAPRGRAPARRHRRRHRPQHPPRVRRARARAAGRAGELRDPRARGPLRGAGQRATRWSSSPASSRSSPSR